MIQLKLGKQCKIEHRDDGAIIYKNGKGQLHRLDGPAYKSLSCESYWLNGKRHNENGPAVSIAHYGEEYWLNDRKMSKEHFNTELAKLKETNKDKK